MNSRMPLGALSVLAMAALTACEGSVAALESDGRVSATVERVIDGDTIVVAHGDQSETVRLLNVDTPETKHPSRAVECLGPEAEAFLEELLQPGDSVELEFDEELTDRYDRVLAGVFADDILVSSEIARHGYGSAVVYQPNEKFYPRVQAAEQEAREAQVGLFSEDVDCTLPAVVGAALAAAEALPAELPTELEELQKLSSRAGDAAVLLVEALDLLELVEDGTNVALGMAYGDDIDGHRSTVDDAAEGVEELQEDVDGLIEEIEEREAEEREQRAREAAEQESEREAEAEAPSPPPADPASQPAQTPQPEEPAPSVPQPQPSQTPQPEEPAPSVPQPQPSQTPQPEEPAPSAPQTEESGGGGNPNMGPEDRPAGHYHREEPTSYTGPRCFLPGGQWWKPC